MPYFRYENQKGYEALNKNQFPIIVRQSSAPSVFAVGKVAQFLRESVSGIC
jgi:hypothetical protein